MREEVVERLLRLNRAFYEGMAGPFARSREEPPPGFYRLLAELPEPHARLLDVGCGEGRFGRFLRERQAIEEYTGVDFSAELLARAEGSLPGRFIQRDLSRPGRLEGLGDFEVIACLAALQHIPARANRLGLLREMKGHLAPGGRIFLSTWQFLDSPRQQRKVVEWEQIGLDAAEVEPNDYLLRWQRGGAGLRYVCLIDAGETAVLAQESGLTILNHFRSDGREGDLSLYMILGHHDLANQSKFIPKSTSSILLSTIHPLFSLLAQAALVLDITHLEGRLSLWSNVLLTPRLTRPPRMLQSYTEKCCHELEGTVTSRHGGGYAPKG